MGRGDDVGHGWLDLGTDVGWATDGLSGPEGRTGRSRGQLLRWARRGEQQVKVDGAVESDRGPGRGRPLGPLERRRRLRLGTGRPCRLSGARREAEGALKLSPPPALPSSGRWRGSCGAVGGRYRSVSGCGPFGLEALPFRAAQKIVRIRTQGGLERALLADVASQARSGITLTRPSRRRPGLDQRPRPQPAVRGCASRLA